jgi:hypothetical protein
MEGTAKSPRTSLDRLRDGCGSIGYLNVGEARAV